MKKNIIMMLAIFSAVSFYGCSKVDVEKMPVTITDKVSADSSLLSDETIVDNDDTEDAKDTKTTNDQSTTSKDIDGSTESSVEVPDAESSDQPLKLTIEIEGMKEEMNGKLFNSSLGYQMVYDSDRFKVSTTDTEVDSYMAENPNPEIYPYIYININRYDKAFWEKEITLEDKNDSHWTDLMIGSAYYLDEVTIASYQAKHYHSSPGDKWDTIITDYYIIEHGDYYYMIQTQYFLEAAEGYGARIKAMLDTFKFE